MHLLIPGRPLRGGALGPSIRSGRLSQSRMCMWMVPNTLYPVVTKLMKGVYNSRPPELRYSSSWRVAKVTGSLSRMGANTALTLKQLTWKRHHFRATYPDQEEKGRCSTKEAVIKQDGGHPHRRSLVGSYVQPHKPISSQQIANWLKLVLEQAGINTQKFSAHSTRGASATAAAVQGVPLAQILQDADWSSESTFNEFY